MHSDIHLSLHRLRVAELRERARTRTLVRSAREPGPRRRPALRARLGWGLVELGLRLVQPVPRRVVRP